MSPRDVHPGRLVVLLDPPRLRYRLTRGGKVPLTGAAGLPIVDPRTLDDPGRIVEARHGRALVTWPGVPLGLWLDLDELATLDPTP